MHYYKRNIGDYAKKAGRLSMLEHGAYTLLLDSCYDREQFPTEREAIEWCWARTDEEVAAVRFVLARFFTKRGDIYVQTRVEEELAGYKEKSETNKRIATEREAKRTNRSRVVSEESETEHEAPPNHKPLTTNHSVTTVTHKTRAKSAVDIPGVPAELLNEWRKIRKADITQTVADGLLREAEKAGISAEQAVRTCCERVWRGFRADWLRDKSIKPDKPSRHSGFDEQNYRDLGAFA